MATKVIPEELFADADAGMSHRSLGAKYGIDRRQIKRALDLRAAKANAKKSSGNDPLTKYREIIDEVDEALSAGHVTPMSRSGLLAQKRGAVEAIERYRKVDNSRTRVSSLAEMLRDFEEMESTASNEDEREQLQALYTLRYGQDVSDLLHGFSTAPRIKKPVSDEEGEAF